MGTLIKNEKKSKHGKALRKKETFLLLSLFSSVSTNIHSRFHKGKDFTMEVVSEDEIRESRPESFPYVL